MSLSAEERRWLHEIEPDYRYTGDELEQQTLSCFVSPSRGGKSTLISGIVKAAHNPKFIGEVNTITTRQRRPGEDPAGYRTADEGVTHDWMLERIHANELVQWTAFETGDLYATDPQSYPAKHNLLPTQEKALRMLGRAGFASMHIIYVVRPVEDWVKHFPAVITDHKQLGRLQEAEKSLDFAEHTPGIIRVVNYEDPELFAQTTASLLQIVQTPMEEYRSGTLAPYHEHDFEKHRFAMAEAARELIENAQIAA